MQTTRVFECPSCHTEVVESEPATRMPQTRAGEFAATTVQCPNCGTEAKYDTGSAEAGDSPLSAIVPCTTCGTVVEAYGVSEKFVEHVANNPELHDVHTR